MIHIFCYDDGKWCALYSFQASSRGKAPSGTSTPSNSHSGAHPCATSYSSSVRPSRRAASRTASLCARYAARPLAAKSFCHARAWYSSDRARAGVPFGASGWLCAWTSVCVVERSQESSGRRERTRAALG